MRISAKSAMLVLAWTLLWRAGLPALAAAQDQPRSPRTTDLVLLGVSTGGVVLSTLRAAADLDYQILAVADACAGCP